MHAPIPTNNLYLAQARASTDSKHCMELYDKWAATYNAEVGDEAQNYVAPVLVAQAAMKFSLSNGAADSVILDAGCGTGLVGEALAVANAKAIDGIDLSPAMLGIARQTGVYRDLTQADMNRPIDKPDGTYDIVSCVGTFTQGHVGPDPALRELVRVTKTNGIVIATILDEIWVSGGFKAEVEKLKEEGLVNVVTDELIDYVKGHGDKAVLAILEKNPRP
jgi:SAM-dependent methyltransferase